MRRSLLVRLLGLSLAVAVFAIAATAWLTTTGTSERLRGEFERTLEADSYAYQQLLAHARTHDSWDGVDGLVDDLAERTGHRVALTSPDGDVLADSSADGGGGGELPSTPTAEIDPAAPRMMMTAAESTTEGLTPVAGTFAWAAPLRTAWRLTEAEATSREHLAHEATVCARRVQGGEVVVDADGSVLRLSGSLAPDTPLPTDTPTQGAAKPDTGASGRGSGSVALTKVEPCIPEELQQPSEATKKFNRRQTELTAACLDDAGLSYSEAVDPYGLTMLVGSREQQMSAEWRECVSSARDEAIQPFIADPALLYMGSADRFDAFSGSGWARTLLTGLAVLAVATGVTVVAGRRLTHPIRTLTVAARRMGSGARGARVPVTGRDDVAELGHAFNAMAESIETSEHQRKVMVGDVAHELRTPLANVRGYLEAAEDGVVPIDSALITSLLEESSQLHRLVDDLQDLALADAGVLRMHPEPVDAVDLAQQVVSGHRTSAEQAGVAVTVSAPEPAEVDADPARLRQALANLVGNAVQYTPEGGHVAVTVSHVDDELVLAVEDDGPGIAAEHLPHLFDRFYRPDTSRTRATGGSGLGLAITRHLVELHGGTVDVCSTEGSGSRFTIRLPVHAPVGA
ncbi:two-component system sensor histidine kinase BaeS [Haloactinopolyspora alba]|uniref:Signal transduction histidine-protein kinase/phosphatase MprB n=2 Tax=Haloactinopolyspora alba TaxID=648780 RepID=A0A2P8D5B2_9ACTN|nr:two-component system sensor histidine kinase BaeS [Haloactinopolyspora alba]